MLLTLGWLSSGFAVDFDGQLVRGDIQLPDGQPHWSGRLRCAVYALSSLSTRAAHTHVVATSEPALRSRADAVAFANPSRGQPSADLFLDHFSGACRRRTEGLDRIGRVAPERSR